MLRFALTFAILAVLAGVLGFGGVAAGFATIAKIGFFLFLGMAIIAMVNHAMRGDVV